MNLIIRTIRNTPGIFRLRDIDPLPAPVGVEIEGESGDIVYLGSALDKMSMRGDRLNIFRDFNLAINQVKHEQTGKAN